MAEYRSQANREINGEYMGIPLPFQVGMRISYHGRGSYLKLHMKVEELGHEIARDEFAENFTAETMEKMFGAFDEFAERAAHVAELGDAVHFPGAQREDNTIEFRHRLKDALHSEAYELMAMM